jgi:phospholipase/carboxylesterase
MSASIALTAPACLAAFGVLSGRILSEIDPIVSTDLASYSLEGLVMHGRDDTVLPFHLAEASARRLDALGVRHSLLAYAGMGHAMSEAMRRDFRQWTGKQFGGLFDTACR